MLHKDLNTYEGLNNEIVGRAISTFNTDEYVDLNVIQNTNKHTKDKEYHFYAGICTQCFIVKLFDDKEMETLKKNNLIDPNYHLFLFKWIRGK